MLKLARILAPRAWCPVLATAAGVLCGCQAQLKESSFVIQSFISRVTDASGTIVAVLRTGTAPTPSGGPDATVSGIATMINGGSSQQSLTGSGNFTTVIVAIPGFQNYYELTLPSSALQAGIVIGANADLGNTSFVINYGLANGGAPGTYASQTMRIIRVGTGDVQVSVSWDAASDVDLHVVDPNGEEVYYGHRASQSGGTLDLDSNAACSLDHKNNENIVWPTGRGLRGSYTVRVDYWSSCTVSQTNFVVTVATAGGTPQIFTGSFTGTGDAGGVGSGQLITTFVY